MSRFRRGDVVLVYFCWEVDGKITCKLRPGVIVDEVTHEDRLIIQCTSKNRSDKLPGIWVLANSAEGIQMGLKVDTFINFSEKIELPVNAIVRLIGKCPFMAEIDEYFGF